MSVPVDSSRPREDALISSHVRPSSYPDSDGGAAAERLTDDLLVEILSRVPAKSLCRFKCVSNHWLGLIDHPDHRKKLPQALAGFFYTTSSTKEGRLLHSPVQFTSVSSGRRRPPVDASLAFLPSHRTIYPLDCCNGLLLCRWYEASGQQVDAVRYVVCNPATEEWVELPSSGQPGTQVVSTLLGFDPALSPQHFHVFEFVEENLQWIPNGVALYSSETRTWVYKENRCAARIQLIKFHVASVFLNGRLHLEADGHELPYGLAVVDTQGETWMNFAVPGGLYDGFLQRSQDKLYYANFHRDEGGDGLRLVVYVLENYQSKEWILMHDVQTSYVCGEIDVFPRWNFCWVAVRPECGLIFFTTSTGYEQGWKFMCYNMDRRQAQVISNLEDAKPQYLPYVPLYAELQSLQI